MTVNSLGVAAAALAVSFVVAISAGPAGGVAGAAPAEATARAFLDALGDGDEQRMASLLTSPARGAFEGDRFLLSDDARPDRAEVGEAVVEGDEATVPAEVVEDGEAREVEVLLRREEGEWRVRALRTGLGAASITMDFEAIGAALDAALEEVGETLRDELKEAFEDLAQGGSPEEIARETQRFESLEPVTLEEVERRTTNRRDLRGRTSLEAIASLVGPLGVAVEPGPHAEALSREVEVDVRGLCLLEAVERIAGEAGLVPDYPDLRLVGGSGDGGAGSEDDGAVEGAGGEATERAGADASGNGETAATAGGVDGAGGDVADGAVDDVGDHPELFGPGNGDAAIRIEAPAAHEATTEELLGTSEDPPPNGVLTFEEPEPTRAVAFRGPFLLEVREVEEHPSHAVGTLRLEARALGLAPSVTTVLEASPDLLHVERVESPAGRELREHPDLPDFTSGTVTMTGFQDLKSIDLAGLLRDVERIERLVATLRLVLPDRVEEVVLDGVSEGATAEAGGLELEVTDHGELTVVEIRGAEPRLERLVVKARATSAGGADLGKIQETLIHHHGETARFRLQTPDAPARLALKLVETTSVEHAFELTGIPLTRHAEQPAQLAPLVFEGSAPLEVELVSLGERTGAAGTREATVRLASRANKDATMVRLDVRYLDASGEELSSVPLLLGATPGPELGVVVPSGETVETEATLIQVPDEMAKVALVLERVELVDATDWEAPERGPGR